MTPTTSTSPFCTALQMLLWCDWQVVADLCHDGLGDRPSRAALLDQTKGPGQVLYEHLLAASGELQTATLAGNRYTATDLAALVTAGGSGGKYLARLVAGLARWSLQQRRHPESADPEKVPGAKQAQAVLEMLKNGERILPFEEAAAAGGGPTSTPLYDEATEPGGGRTVSRASRVFDTREGY
jgi:hypothetical protein